MAPKRVLITYGVDVDAVAGWLGSYGGEDSTRPGMNHVDWMSYFLNNFNNRWVPIVPAQYPIRSLENKTVAGWLGSYGGEDSTNDISRGRFQCSFSGVLFSKTLEPTSADIVCGILSTIRAQPTGYSVNIHTIGNEC
jgi:hypothetical protein